jgi:hypothetical protein
MIMSATRLSLSALLVCALLAMSARADVIFQTDFTGANGTIPADTTLTLGTTAIMAISGNQLRNGAIGTPRLVYTGTSAATLTDYTVDCDIYRANGGGWLGLVARAQTSGTDQSAYLLRLNRAGVGQPFNLLQLVRLSATGVETTLDTETLTENYVAPNIWHLTLSVIGSSITGSILNTGGTQVGQVSATDATLTSGTAGCHAQYGAANIYDNLVINTIPEPASLGLLAAGGLLLASPRRLR